MEEENLTKNMKGLAYCDALKWILPIRFTINIKLILLKGENNEN